MKFDKDESGEKLPLTNEELLKIFTYKMNHSHSNVMDELKNKVALIEGGIDHIPAKKSENRKEAWKEEREQEQDKQEEMKNKI